MGGMGGVQQRPQARGLGQGDLRQPHIQGLGVKARLLPSGAQQHQGARRQHTAMGRGQIGRAGLVQAAHCGVAVAFQKHRSRTPRGVIGQLRFCLKQQNTPQRRQPRSRAGPGNTATDNDKIKHDRPHFSAPKVARRRAREKGGWRKNRSP